MSDLLHTHLTLGLRPKGECPACDQLRADIKEHEVMEVVQDGGVTHECAVCGRLGFGEPPELPCAGDSGLKIMLHTALAR